MFRNKIELFAFGAIVFTGGIIAGVHIYSSGINELSLVAAPYVAQKEAISKVQAKSSYDTDKLAADMLSIYGGLRLGAEGAAISNLQNILSGAGVFNSKPTGYFGPITVSAIKKFQEQKGLTQTGLVDKSTAKALAVSTSSMSVVYQIEDLELFSFMYPLVEGLTKEYVEFLVDNNIDPELIGVEQPTQGGSKNENIDDFADQYGPGQTSQYDFIAGEPLTVPIVSPEDGNVYRFVVRKYPGFFTFKVEGLDLPFNLTPTFKFKFSPQDFNFGFNRNNPLLRGVRNQDGSFDIRIIPSSHDLGWPLESFNDDINRFVDDFINSYRHYIPVKIFRNENGHVCAEFPDGSINCFDLNGSGGDSDDPIMKKLHEWLRDLTNDLLPTGALPCEPNTNNSGNNKDTGTLVPASDVQSVGGCN